MASFSLAEQMDMLPVGDHRAYVRGQPAEQLAPTAGVPPRPHPADQVADPQREQRRQRAEKLAAKRRTSPIPVGRSHAEVLADRSRWTDWVDQAETGTL